MMRRPSARRSADQTCASCPSSPPNSWPCRPFIGFAVAWLLIASGSSIRSAAFSRSTALSFQRTSAICGELWRGSSAIMRTALSIHWFARLMAELREELIELDARVIGYGRKIRELYRNSEICQRLSKVEGIGPVTATALVAAVGDRSSYKNGRQFE